MGLLFTLPAGLGGSGFLLGIARMRWPDLEEGGGLPEESKFSLRKDWAGVWLN